MIAKQIIKKYDNYLTDISSNFSVSYEEEVFKVDNINFNINYQVTVFGPNNSSFIFQEETTYLVSFSIEKKEYLQTILVKLINSDWNIKDSSNNEQNITYIPLLVEASEGNNDISSNYSFVFKPNSDNYNKIIFQSLGDYDISESEKRIVNLNNIKIEEVNTEKIFNSTEIKKIREFGIQAPPGFLFSINGEGIHVGRTGTFYLAENDFIFESIGVCNNELPFIIDYKIEDEEDEYE